MTMKELTFDITKLSDAALAAKIDEIEDIRRVAQATQRACVEEKSRREVEADAAIKLGVKVRVITEASETAETSR